MFGAEQVAQCVASGPPCSLGSGLIRPVEQGPRSPSDTRQPLRGWLPLAQADLAAERVRNVCTTNHTNLTNDELCLLWRTQACDIVVDRSAIQRAVRKRMRASRPTPPTVSLPYIEARRGSVMRVRWIAIDPLHQSSPGNALVWRSARIRRLCPGRIRAMKGWSQTWNAVLNGRRFRQGRAPSRCTALRCDLPVPVLSFESPRCLFSAVGESRYDPNHQSVSLAGRERRTRRWSPHR